MNRKLLLTEQSNQIELLNESVNGVKKLKIEGIFAAAEVINGNKRFYKKHVLESSMNTYINEYVSKKRAIGELNHPDYPLPKPEHAAILIEELRWDGNNVYGKAVVLDTPKGQIVKGLLEGGFALGVSTRALGTITEKAGIKYVNEGLITTAIDCVDMPSGPNCYVGTLMESIQESAWSFDNGILVKEDNTFDEDMYLEFIEDFIKQLKSSK